MLGCFNPILGKIWTNPAIFNPMAGFVHILPQIWVKKNSIF